MQEVHGLEARFHQHEVGIAECHAHLDAGSGQDEVISQGITPAAGGETALVETLGDAVAHAVDHEDPAGVDPSGGEALRQRGQVPFQVRQGVVDDHHLASRGQFGGHGRQLTQQEVVKPRIFRQGQAHITMDKTTLCLDRFP